MPILSKEEFIAAVGNNSGLLALDVGTKTIGMAVCNGLRISATPLRTIIRRKFKLDSQAVFEAYDEYECKALIVGWPLEMDGKAGRRCQGVRDFTRALLDIRDVAAFFFDERLTSVEAEEHMIKELNLSRHKRKKNIDKIAAHYILQRAILELEQG